MKSQFGHCKTTPSPCIGTVPTVLNCKGLSPSSWDALKISKISISTRLSILNYHKYRKMLNDDTGLTSKMVIEPLSNKNWETWSMSTRRTVGN